MFVIPPPIDQTVTGAVYAFAVLKGRTPERTVGGILGVIWLWNTLVHRWLLHPRDTYELMIDLNALLLILALALNCDRWWLLVAGMALLLRVATDIANFMVPLHGWAYGTALITWGYVLLAALAAGTWESWRSPRDPSLL